MVIIQCTLEKRRIVHDLVLMYKIILGLLMFRMMSNFFTLRNDAVLTRGNAYTRSY